jgi:Protein of unknown function (DUF3431)
MDEPHLGILHPILNKGREAMAYLTFLIDHHLALLPRPLPSHVPVQEPRHTADAAIGNNALAWASGH